MININGKIYDNDQAKLSVFDRGFLFGDSVYEVVRTYNKKIFLWDEHFARLQSSANKIGLPLSFSQEYITEQLQKTFNKTEGKELYARIIITRGEGGFTLESSNLSEQNLIILVKEMTTYPDDWYKKGVKVIISETLRTDKESVDPSIKSGNYLNNVMAYMEAQKRGFYDAVMLNSSGKITEATTSNIWLVKDGKLETPSISSGILEGITRQTILEICKQNSIAVVEREISMDEIFSADECFLTSSTKEIIPVNQVDSTKIGPGSVGPIYQKIHSLYREYIKKASN